jgi:hypothetical protein
LRNWSQQPLKGKPKQQPLHNGVPSTKAGIGIGAYEASFFPMHFPRRSGTEGLILRNDPANTVVSYCCPLLYGFDLFALTFFFLSMNEIHYYFRDFRPQKEMCPDHAFVADGDVS